MHSMLVAPGDGGGAGGSWRKKKRFRHRLKDCTSHFHQNEPVAQAHPCLPTISGLAIIEILTICTVTVYKKATMHKPTKQPSKQATSVRVVPDSSCLTVPAPGAPQTGCHGDRLHSPLSAWTHCPAQLK